ncbi:MAG TPA: L-rhamnose mutarotase [Chitinophagaceae bacterium]
MHIWLTYFFLLLALAGNGADIYVSPKGSDANDGSKEKPLATVSAALRKAREMRRLNDSTIKNGIHIILRGGVYVLKETIMIRAEDAGTAGSPTFIEAATGEQPVLSGGVMISGWKKLLSQKTGLPAAASGNVWVADVPVINGELFEFRQLWVNDVKAVRAKSVNGDRMLRILNWSKKDESCWIPTPKFPVLANATGVELFIHQWWAIAMLRIKKMEMQGDSTQLFFHQPESRIQNEHPWPAPWLSKETGNSAFYLVNALQFLDEPGEWYLDIAARKIYYWPRRGEDLQTASVVAPYLETLLKIEGTIDRPVRFTSFGGISFQHTGWLRPSHFGHVPHQAGMYMTEAYRLRPAGTKEKPGLDNQAWIGRPAAAVELNFADNTEFENCRFEHLASTGLDYHKAVHNNVVKGSLFKDIGGSGLLAGVYSDPGHEIHLPCNPTDEREICDGMVIAKNLITDATNEDWSCVGIGLGYTRNSRVEHNEVENVSYTGISMGWGWTTAPNAMKNNKIIGNKIHHYGKHNYDCSGIYTLSAQPGSVISENYIDSIYKAPYAHLPSHWFYIYADEGSSGFTVKDNWTPSTKYLQNANGPGNEWSNNGPGAAETIKLSAGLQTSYQWLLGERAASKLNLPINEEHNEVIGMVVKDGKQIDLTKLKELLTQNNIDGDAIYQWQNHYVIFAKIADVGVMQGRIQNNFPDTEVKVYHDLFYEYNKKKHCPDKSVAKEWEYVLLTANLVADKKLQNEYLDYHATQFQKWPDIAKGFCNADFQQLLIFRNGRRLVLVISIPKGKTLDELNPKTTENNPKMVEWNKIMGKYQEGIPGTKPGETWVFLNPL